MPSIFPSSGVLASEALNTVNVDAEATCGDELFHSTSRCQPRFDPAAANAVMSELLNLVGGTGTGVGGQGPENTWDCSRLDNVRQGVRDFISQVIQNGCYDLDNIGTDCNIQQVAYVQDTAGCGRLVIVNSNPLPTGLQVLQAGEPGNTETVFNENQMARSDRLEVDAGFPDTVHFYRVTVEPLEVRLDATEFCGLATAGTLMTAEFYASIGYSVDMATPGVNVVQPYQYGLAVYLDGVLVGNNTDGFGVNQSGVNSFLADKQQVDFVTTGADLVFELVPHIRVDTTDSQYTQGDRILVDMAQVSARWERRF